MSTLSSLQPSVCPSACLSVPQVALNGFKAGDKLSIEARGTQTVTKNDGTETTKSINMPATSLTFIPNEDGSPMMASFKPGKEKEEKEEVAVGGKALCYTSGKMLCRGEGLSLPITQPITTVKGLGGAQVQGTGSISLGHVKQPPRQISRDR